MEPRQPIRLLSDTVINQIAAGEVVERPAAVLKELVENALDAGAQQIEVDVVDGGRRLIRVRDDGVGMDRDNALLSIERHATSKLRDLKDLDSITTMGFRGEALAAISAVSQFSLVTRHADSPTGTEIMVFGGKVQEVRDAGAPVGTEISVRNLFFNVPARRKFLRTAQTEFTHIRQAFWLEALAHVDRGFVLRADDADVVRLPPASSLLERIRDLYGDDVARHLAPLNFGNGVIEISGHAGVPPFSRLDREWQVVFINGRPSGSPVVNYAIQTAYRSVLPGGRFAPLFVQIQLPGEMVDVNVHPAKKEVRFRRPTEVRDVIIEAIRMAISGSESPRPAPAGTSPSARTLGPALAGGAPVPSRPASVTGSVQVPPMQPRLDWSPPPAANKDEPPPPNSPWGEYRLMGRLAGGYVVLETRDGLVLMDSKSAHERVLYERFLCAMDKGPVPSQGLLPPATVPVSPAQSQSLSRYLELLRRMGFGLAEFGEGTFIVDALPVEVAGVDPAPLLSDIADGLLQGGRGAAQDWVLPMVAATAGRQAVSSRQHLNDAELEALIRDLSGTEMPYTSPRGKPTIILLSYRELDRKFGRD